MEKSEFIKKQPYFCVGVIGLFVIIFGLLLSGFFPKEAKMPKGFNSPIIYYEFIKSPAEVNDFFRITDDGIADQAFVNQMDKGNQIDFAFAFVYSLFLFLFFKKLVQVSDIKWYKAGIILALLAFIGDITENIQLLGITANLESGNYQTQLILLQVFTWLKWISLAISFVIFSTWKYKFKGVYRFMAFIAVIPIVLGLAAIIKRGIINELFSKSVSIMFFVMICYCFIYHIDNKKQKTDTESI